MHDAVGSTDVLRMASQGKHDVQIGIRAGTHDAAMARSFLDGDLEASFALCQRHGEELSLLAGDEQSTQSQRVRPMAKIATEAPFHRTTGLRGTA